MYKWFPCQILLGCVRGTHCATQALASIQYTARRFLSACLLLPDRCWAFEMREPCCDPSVYCFTKRKPVFIPVNAFDSSEMELRVVLPDFEARPCAALITLLESNVMESCEPLTVA